MLSCSPKSALPLKPRAPSPDSRVHDVEPHVHDVRGEVHITLLAAAPRVLAEGRAARELDQQLLEVVHRVRVAGVADRRALLQVCVVPAIAKGERFVSMLSLSFSYS
jgi:hypothetical protein